MDGLNRRYAAVNNGSKKKINLHTGGYENANVRCNRRYAHKNQKC